MLLTMLYAVYVDTVDEKRIVAIPAFRSLLETATTREGSDIVLEHDTTEDEDDGGESPENHASLLPIRRRLAFRVRGGDRGDVE